MRASRLRSQKSNDMISHTPPNNPLFKARCNPTWMLLYPSYPRRKIKAVTSAYALFAPALLISLVRAREVVLNCADIRFSRRLQGAISFDAVNVTQRCDARRDDAMRGRKLPPILLSPRKAFRSSLSSREHRERKLKFHAIADNRARVSEFSWSFGPLNDRSID